MEVKALQEPHGDGCYENHGEGFCDEILRLFPEELSHVSHPRHSVIGQFHYKGNRLPTEQCSLIEKSDKNRRHDSEKIKSCHDQTAPSWEKGVHEERVDRKFCRTTHERGQKDGHPSVPAAGKGSCGHDRRHRTAETDEHGHDTSSRKTDSTEDLIHKEGHTGDVAAVLHQGQEEKQGDNDGQEAENTADAAKDTVDHQAVKGIVDVYSIHPPVHTVGDDTDSTLQQPLKEGSDYIEGEPEYQCHNSDKAGNSRPLTGKNPVDPLRSLSLTALFWLYHRFFTDTLNEIKAHVRDGGTSIHTAFLFHLCHDALQHLVFILIQMQLACNQRIPLYDFRRGKTQRQPRLLGMILDNRLHRVNGPVNRAAVIIPAAKILSGRPLLILRNVNGMVNQLRNTLVLRRRDGNHRHSKHGFHAVDVNGAVISRHFIHHVESHHHGNVHLQKLHGQVQVSLNIRGIHDVDDGGRFLMKDKIP